VGGGGGDGGIVERGRWAVTMSAVDVEVALNDQRLAVETPQESEAG